MAEQTQEIFIESKIIVCEGDSDRRFLDVLLQRRNINSFQTVKHASGKGGFTNRLRTIRTNDDFAMIKTIILVRDNDDNPTSSFADIVKQVQKAGDYPVPTRPLEVAKAKNGLGIVIVMLPWTDQEGGLETLVLESISGKEPQVRECLTEYLACTPARSWNTNKQSKMLLACMVAGIVEKNPVGSLSYLWNEENNLKNLLDHQCFNKLATFFLSLPT